MVMTRMNKNKALERATLEVGAAYTEFAVNFEKEVEADLEQLKMIEEMQKSLGLLESESKANGLKTNRDTDRQELKINRLEPGGAQQIVEVFTAVGGFAGIALVLKTLQPIIVQLLKNRGARGISVKTKDRTITIKGSNDVDEAIRLLNSMPKETKKPEFNGNEGENRDSRK